MSMQIQEVTALYELDEARKATPEAVSSIVRSIENGASIHEACKAVGISAQTLGVWRVQSDALNQRITAALDVYHDNLADKLKTAHEDIPDVQKAKLFSDNVKWLVSKRDKRYGDKLDISVDHKVDLAGALTEARGRVLSASYQRIEREPESLAFAEVAEQRATDAISGGAPDAPTLDDLLS